MWDLKERIEMLVREEVEEYVESVLEDAVSDAYDIWKKERVCYDVYCEVDNILNEKITETIEYMVEDVDISGIVEEILEEKGF